MRYEEFLKEVEKRGHLSSVHDAERATQAALETLAEWISTKERLDAAAQLPRGLALYLKQPYLGAGNQPTPHAKRSSSLEEFFQRMGLREGVPPEVAHAHARAVMGVLRDALSKGELDDIHEQLPIEFHYEFFLD